MARRIFLLLLCICCGTVVSAQDFSRLDWGPFLGHYEDLMGAEKTQVLGPFLEKSETPSGQEILAFRPFISGMRHPAQERSWWEYVWPIATSKRFKNDFSARFLLAWYTDFDVTDPDSRYRFWIVPFYFQGRDASGNSYMALFPLVGTLNEFLIRDKIFFALFPLYVSSSVGDVKSHSVLWPLISRTTGKGIYRFRFLPFYAQNRHRDQYVKRSIMWPFWHSSEYYMPGSEGSVWMLFPFLGHVNLQDQKAWMVFPPFFRFSYGQRMHETFAPWPIFQKSKGETEKITLWPLYGKKSSKGNERSYFLWPIYRHERVDRKNAMVRDRHVILPFFQFEKDEQLPLDEHDEPYVANRYVNIWPLYSYWRVGDKKRIRMIELWPYRNTGPVERSYAPFWNIYRHVADGDRSETDMLWGFYRGARDGRDYSYQSLFPLVQYERDNEKDFKGWSILKGLLGYERNGSERLFRLLYFLKFRSEEGNDKDT